MSQNNLNHEPDTSEPSAGESTQATADSLGLTEFSQNIYWVLSDQLPSAEVLAEAGLSAVIKLTDCDAATYKTPEVTRSESAELHSYELPITEIDDLIQLNIMRLDELLRRYIAHSKVLITGDDPELIASSLALRLGWLRGRRIDKCVELAEQHGVTTMRQELFNRLLVPR